MSGEVGQLCANPLCDALVPAQIGPRLCPRCEGERSRLVAKHTPAEAEVLESAAAILEREAAALRERASTARRAALDARGQRTREELERGG